jgi:hypothetical protein
MTRSFALIWTGVFWGSCAMGQINGVSIVGATPTQAVLAYTAPPGVTCTWTVSESPALTPVVHDVDPTLFHNANLDNRPGNISQGRRHVFVIGNRTAEVALNGHRVSRALQVFTPLLRHQLPIGGGQRQLYDSQPGCRQSISRDSARGPGEYSWPDMPYTDTSPQMIDPLSGILFQPLSRPGEKTDYRPSGSQTNHCSVTLSGGGYHCDFGGFSTGPAPAWERAGSSGDMASICTSPSEATTLAAARVLRIRPPSGRTPRRFQLSPPVPRTVL